MKTLIAIDGNSLMHRAYYALPNMTTRSGIPTGALHGFLSMLLKLVERQPDYLLVAFDVHGPTFRHEKYADYKAGRRETPDELKSQFPQLKQVLARLGIKVIECPGYEADDILGTFAARAQAADVSALLVTGDRDALQLISPSTHVLMTKKGISETIEYDEQELYHAYGLTPARMRDLKGLMGDSSDHIPGIPGVGEKTALKLLAAYGSLEETLCHAKEVKGKLGERLQEFGDQARLSYWLGCIDTNAPVEAALEDCAFSPAHMQDAAPLLLELELRTIASRLPGEAAKPAVRSLQMESEWETIAIEDEAGLLKMVQALQSAGQVALAREDGALSLAGNGRQYVISLSGTLLEPGLDPAQVWQALKPVLEDAAIQKLVFDAKGWMHLLARQAIQLKNASFDAMIADYLLNAIRPTQSLGTLAQERLGAGAKGDAVALVRLYSPMLEEMREKGLMELYETVELPLISVLYDMEREGFMVDGTILKGLQQEFGQRIAQLAREIYQHAGEEFNILSTKQLGAVLFEKLGLPAKKKTKTGYSTDADVLEALADQHPIVALVQEYRFLTKLKSTFVDGLLAMIDPRTGRVHTSFNQNVTATGRISSTEPNLQNIPVRTPLGREIRKAFVASPGNLLVGADYSQIELRLLAHISGDAAMQDAFRSGGDIHARTASEVFDTPLSQVTPQQRSAAKAVNFGIVYGISDFGLARNLGIDRKRAGEYIKRYLERYPGVADFMHQSVERGKQEGCVKTLLGRRRELPELKSSNYNTRSFGERVAMNMPIQGTAADIIKLAMVRAHRALAGQELKAKLVLQVHDELIFDVPRGEEEAVAKLVQECMEGAMRLCVPLIAEVKSGHSWYDTK